MAAGIVANTIKANWQARSLSLPLLPKSLSIYKYRTFIMILTHSVGTGGLHDAPTVLLVYALRDEVLPS